MVDRITVEDDVCLSTTEAAHRLGITPRTLYRFIDDGRIPAYRFGRLIRVQVVDHEEFIEPCRITPGRWRSREHAPTLSSGDETDAGRGVAAFLAVVGYRLSGAPNSSAR